MKITSLWKSLVQSRRRHLRRQPARGNSFGIVAAEVLEYRQLLSAASPGMTLTVQGSNVTLTSTDINNPTVTITRSGGNVVLTGASGTLITFGSNVAAVQTVAITTVNNLTVGLGTGTNTVTITGLSVAGNITINGQASGIANIAINAGAPNVVIGGSIQANMGSEASTFGLFGSTNGGGNLTVTGSVNIDEAGPANKQVNIYGPPANNPTGGTLTITGSVNILDTGNGISGLHIDDGVTFGGNVSFNNSANTVNADNVQIYSNSFAFGTTSIAGSLTLALSQVTTGNNVVQMQGFGTPLVVTGTMSIVSWGAADNILLANDWFKDTVKIATGTSPSVSQNLVALDGSRFDGATTIFMTGPNSELDLGTNALDGATVFNGGFIAAPNQVYVTDYVNAAGKAVHLVQTGTSSVIFIDGTGHMSLGTFNSPTTMTTPAYPGDVATASKNMSVITWTDGTVWTQAAATTAISVTRYTNAKGVPVDLIQNGTSQVAFIDGLGQVSLGTTVNANTGQSNLYPGDVATISSSNITWQDGSVWTHTTVIPLAIGVSDPNGVVSHVKMTSATTLIGLDGAMQGLTATLVNGALVWSNGDTWNNFTFNALAALFSLGSGYA